MNAQAALFFAINAVALLAVPRRWAPLPLMIGACYMTFGQQVLIGPFHFTVIRMLLFVGILRAVMRGERVAGGMLGLDWIIVFWSAWALFTSLFTETLVAQLGLVYNVAGIYFLIRIFTQSSDDAVLLTRIVAVILIPVALEMILEQLTGQNMFSVFGGVPQSVVVRGERLRAQGPFGHAILAGTVGAACLPLMAGLWLRHRRDALIGSAGCLVMIVTCASSGPLASVLAGVLALILWRWRRFTKQMRIGAVVAYVLLDLVMKAPAYYLIGRIDLTGSSTGWHRAELIHQAILHFREWWFAGTTYTRHWMPYGVTWSPDHCDITNEYIGYGVNGGLPLMLLFIAALAMGFRYIGLCTAAYEADPARAKFAWTVGSALFAQGASCLSVFYFDQSFIFLYLNLALAGSLYGAMRVPVETTSSVVATGSFASST